MKKFVASYSGRKDSILAIHRALKMGCKPLYLITTYNIDKSHSWFHGIPEPVLNNVSESLQIPIKLIKTTRKDYANNFEDALSNIKN